MHQTIFIAGIIPEEHAGFLLLSAADSFGLQLDAGFAVKFVCNSYVGRLVESHKPSQFWKDGCD